MPALPNSNDLPTSKSVLTTGDWVAATLLLMGLSAAAIFYCYTHGYLLYYGDAQAHLNIARRLLDSRTPGWDQIGTVWLPLPHFLTLPFALNDEFWKSGLAGAFGSGFCFVLGGLFFLATLAKATDNRGASWCGLLILATNPNLLYLQSLPMTESIFLACAMALIYFLMDESDSRQLSNRSKWTIVGAAMAANAACLTRYEGWFLTGCAALYLFVRKGWRSAFQFSVLASAAPLWWLFHNWFYYGDALEFYRGEYSARAIYERALAQPGGFKAPGDQDWSKALEYFEEAVKLTAGHPLTWIGIVGMMLGIFQRTWLVLLLFLSPWFYVWSLHSSGTPIFVPTLWPNSFYNTRYALSALPFLATGAVFVARLGRWLYVPLLLAALWPWLQSPDINSVLCWKESAINSRARRPWVQQAAAFLKESYQPGTGILTSGGDVLAIYGAAGIPLREVLFDGNNPMFLATTQRPKAFLKEKWVIAQQGDSVDVMAGREKLMLWKRIQVEGASTLNIYRTR
jgi:hypothetical protein